MNFASFFHKTTAPVPVTPEPPIWDFTIPSFVIRVTQEPPESRKHLFLTITLDKRTKITGGSKIMFQMTDDAAGAALSLTLTDSKGNPTTPASPPIWTESSAGALLSLSVGADGTTATIVPVGPLGTAQVNVTVEGDPTPGKDTHTGSLSVTVVAGEVANVVVNAQPIQAVPGLS
jgi:hypothetical protein